MRLSTAKCWTCCTRTAFPSTESSLQRLSGMSSSKTTKFCSLLFRKTRFKGTLMWKNWRMGSTRTTWSSASGSRPTLRNTGAARSRRATILWPGAEGPLSVAPLAGSGLDHRWLNRLWSQREIPYRAESVSGRPGCSMKSNS